ncbi:hypothetical protein HMI54_006550 [Coelomomyces lativittatus]|nr:hypothetical protein HMI54_006550 [Coelomomyces lativittatus]
MNNISTILKKKPLRILNNPHVPPEVMEKFRRRAVESESSKNTPAWTKNVHTATIVFCMSTSGS